MNEPIGTKADRKIHKLFWLKWKKSGAKLTSHKQGKSFNGLKWPTAEKELRSATKNDDLRTYQWPKSEDLFRFFGHFFNQKNYATSQVDKVIVDWLAEQNIGHILDTYLWRWRPTMPDASLQDVLKMSKFTIRFRIRLSVTICVLKPVRARRRKKLHEINWFV